MGEQLIIPHLGILVTTYCNLNCRRCADLIPKRGRCHYELEDMKRDLQKVLSAVDYIEEVLVIGGEVLLYPQLREVLSYCRAQQKVGKIIITTNGTIIPQDAVLECLQEQQVLVRVSGYPEFVAPKRNDIMEAYKCHGIAVEDLEDMRWLDMGIAKRRGRSEAELDAVFRTCSMRDCVCMNREGKIFYCSRQMTAYETDIYPDPLPGEYVDVRKEQELRKRLEKFYRLPHINTCDYCDGISCATKTRVLTAIQTMEKTAFLDLLGTYCMWQEEGIAADAAIETVRDILLKHSEKLYDLTEYTDAILALENWIRNPKEEAGKLLAATVRNLLNALAGDYNYRVEQTIPYAKQLPAENMPNVITVGLGTSGEADILITEEELLREVNAAYPLDGISYNRLFVEGKLARVKTGHITCVVSGLSYTQYGILEASMPVPTANLSVTGQDIPYSLLMAKKAIELNENIAHIIVPMTYYQGFYDMSSDDAALHQWVVSGIDIPILGDARNYAGEDYSNYRNSEALEIYEHIYDMKKLRDARNCQISQKLMEMEYFNGMNPRNPYGGLKFDFMALNEAEKTESAKITADLNERVCTKQGYEEVKRYLAEFLEDERVRGREIIFFVPPMTEQLFQAYHKELRAAYYDKIVTLLEQYENVTFMDLADDKRFHEADFCDFEHLGESGAVKLTQILGACCKENA